MGAPPGLQMDGDEAKAADSLGALGALARERYGWYTGLAVKAPRSPTSPLPSQISLSRYRSATSNSPATPPLSWASLSTECYSEGNSSSSAAYHDVVCHGIQAPRKRHNVVPGRIAADECVAALLPKMKRMRLRPSLGQLRLQREAVDAAQLMSPQVRLCLEPEMLRASLSICCAIEEGIHRAESELQLEISFPPQYPHRHPQVVQVSPERHIPAWQYDGNVVVLTRLSERHWSSAMGVMDIVRDLLQPLSQLGVEFDLREDMNDRLTFLPVPLPSPDDVEMI